MCNQAFGRDLTFKTTGGQDCTVEFILCWSWLELIVCMTIHYADSESLSFRVGLNYTLIHFQP